MKLISLLLLLGVAAALPISHEAREAGVEVSNNAKQNAERTVGMWARNLHVGVYGLTSN